MSKLYYLIHFWFVNNIFGFRLDSGLVSAVSIPEMSIHAIILPGVWKKICNCDQTHVDSVIFGYISEYVICKKKKNILLYFIILLCIDWDTHKPWALCVCSFIILYKQSDLSSIVLSFTLPNVFFLSNLTNFFLKLAKIKLLSYQKTNQPVDHYKVNWKKKLERVSPC